jgi:S1-C subfamily serine protease
MPITIPGRLVRSAALLALLLLASPFFSDLPAPASAEGIEGGPAGEPDMKRLRASVIQVFTTSQSEDYTQPWQRPSPQGSSGSSFCIGNRMLMTNAHVISDAKRLEVKRADRVKHYDARVLFAGHDCDLAVITVDDAEFWDGMQPLEFGPRPAMRSKVMTVGYPMGGSKLSITEGVVSRIEVRTYVHTQADDHLTVQTDAAINPGNSGGPVLQDGKVVGVAFQGIGWGAQNIGYMIAPSVMRHFLDDIADGTYHGYPELGIYTANLRNPGLRAYLGVPEGETGGVLVLKPVPYASAVGKVQRNDVILRIDGVKVEADGTIDIDGEFFDLSWVVENKQIGETVTLSVLREGKVRDVEITLRGWGARMQPRRAYDERPEYLVLGGYVFVPLTKNYLGWGQSNDISYYMEQYYMTVAEEGKTREQLVLLSRVMKHGSTRYIDYDDDIVEKVDGKVPMDFADFVRIIDESDNDLIKVEFEGVNVAPLILDMKKIREVHAEILKRQSIKEDRYVAPKETK